MQRTFSRLQLWLLLLSFLALIVSTQSARASVALVSFDVATSADGKGVEIRWVTGTEKDSAGFIVKRTTEPTKYLEVEPGDDGNNPETIVKAQDDIIDLENQGRTEKNIASRGGVSAGDTYTVYDRSAEVGVTYYYMLVELGTNSSWNDVATDSVTVGEQVTPEPEDGLLIIPTTGPDTVTNSTATPVVEATPTEEGGNTSDETTTSTEATPTVEGEPTSDPNAVATETVASDETSSAEAGETPIPTPTEIGDIAEPTVEGEEATAPPADSAAPGVTPTKTLQPLDTPTPSPTPDPNRSAEDATATAVAAPTELPSAPVEEITSPEQPTASFPEEAEVTATPEPDAPPPAPSSEEATSAPDAPTTSEEATNAPDAPTTSEEATNAPDAPTTSEEATSTPAPTTGEEAASTPPAPTTGEEATTAPDAVPNAEQPTPAPIGSSLPTATPQTSPTEQATNAVINSDPVATAIPQVEQPTDTTNGNPPAEQPSAVEPTIVAPAENSGGENATVVPAESESVVAPDNTTNNSAETNTLSEQPEENNGVPNAEAEEASPAVDNIASNDTSEYEEPGSVNPDGNVNPVTSSGDLPPPSRIGQEEKESGTNPMIWAGFVGAVLVFGAGAVGSIMLFTRRQQKE